MTLAFHKPRPRKRYCYLNALEFLRANPEQPWRLVHGVISPVAGEMQGLECGHAWLTIEHGGETLIYDPSIDGLFREATYQHGAGVRHAITYTREEAEALAAETGNVGPWDEQTSGAVHATRARRKAS